MRMMTSAITASGAMAHLNRIQLGVQANYSRRLIGNLNLRGLWESPWKPPISCVSVRESIVAVQIKPDASEQAGKILHPIR
ncbi:MAG: hypothetical protein AB7U82_03255, partial [Blastocatellales bacterium]